MTQPLSCPLLLLFYYYHSSSHHSLYPSTKEEFGVSFSTTLPTEMKGVRGRFLKKLKLVTTTFHLNTSPLYKHHHHQPQDSCKKDNDLPVLDCLQTKKEDHEPGAEPQTDVLLDEDLPKLTDFEERCPPGGEDSVIFYTTSLKSIRRTHEDCKSVKFLLESLKVAVEERDVSMDKGLREEMWRVVGEKGVPPKVFIRGRYIGGAKEVVSLHEQGKLKKLLQGIAFRLGTEVCSGCGNFRFVICSHCNGSCKVYTTNGGDDDADDDYDDDGLFVRCSNCNENGLVRCSVCCC